MMALVWSVIGIGLVAAMLFGGMSLFNPNAAPMAQIKDTTTVAFQGVSAAYHAYVNANDVPPTNADWYAQLVPSYIPAVKYPVPGTLWSYGSDGTFGNYFCLYGSMAEVAWDAMSAASANFPTNAYYISTVGCGQNPRVNDTKPSSWPTNVYVTYWVRGS